MAGVVAGAGALFLLTPKAVDRVASVEAADARRAARSVSPCPVCPECEGEAASRDCALELAVARGRLKTHEGDPMPWPDDVDPAFSAAEVEGAVRALAAEHDHFRVEAVLCDEFPCLVATTLPADHEGGDPLATLPVYKENRVLASSTLASGDTQLDIRPLSDRSLDELQMTRVAFRIQTAAEYLGEEIRAAVDGSPNGAVAEQLEVTP